jgi:hypothetical protein
MAAENSAGKAQMTDDGKLKEISPGVYSSESKPRRVDSERVAEIVGRLAQRWNDPSRELQAQAEEFLRQSGIRDVVLRHEGQPNEQRFSHVLAFFAANATRKPE